MMQVTILQNLDGFQSFMSAYIFSNTILMFMLSNIFGEYMKPFMKK